MTSTGSEEDHDVEERREILEIGFGPAIKAAAANFDADGQKSDHGRKLVVRASSVAHCALPLGIVKRC